MKNFIRDKIRDINIRFHHALFSLFSYSINSDIILSMKPEVDRIETQRKPKKRDPVYLGGRRNFAKNKKALSRRTMESVEEGKEGPFRMAHLSSNNPVSSTSRHAGQSGLCGQSSGTTTTGRVIFQVAPAISSCYIQVCQYTRRSPGPVAVS